MPVLDHSKYDTRNYPIVEAAVGYAQWAKTYEQIVQDEMDLRLLQRLESVIWADQERVLDLACGTGRIGSWIRQRSSVLIDGLDLTPEMLNLARRSGNYRALINADLRNTGLCDAFYDLCIQSLADEHLPSLRPLYQEAARVTRPQGMFVITGLHPQFFMITGMPTHFERASGERVTIRTYVHLFSDHVAAAVDSGWRLQEMHEGLVDDAWLKRKPKWKKYEGLPISYVMVWLKEA